MQQEDIQRRERRRRGRTPRNTIHEHLNLEQTMKEEQHRKRQHPTSGSTPEIPDRWSTAGSLDRPKR